MWLGYQREVRVLDHIVKVRPFGSMHSMLMLGGSGGMSPRKFFKNRCSEIESGGISGSLYYFKSQINY